MESTLSQLGAAITASLATRILLHPLDTIKTLIQSKNRKQLKTLSLTQYYRGLAPTLAFSIPALSTYLTSYDWIKSYLEKDSVTNHAIAATIAEVLSGAFWTPMEVVKSRLQVGKGDAFTSSYSYALHIYKSKGLPALFKGYSISLVAFVPYSVVYYTSYEQLKSTIKHDKSVADFAICSGLAATFAATTTNILDLIKTRTQVGMLGEHLSGTFRLSRSVRLLAYFWDQEGGFRVLTKGLGSRLLFVVPSAMISFTIYESLK